MVDDSTISYQHFFQVLLEAVPWPLLIVNRSLSIHFYNQHAVHLLEAQGPLKQLKLNQLVSDARILELVQQSIQSQSPVTGEYTRDSTGTAWKISITPLAHSPRRTRISKQNTALNQAYRYVYSAIAIEDLTELRRLERARRDFVANISHELRNPLASIRLLVVTLEDAIDTDPEQAQHLLRKLKQRYKISQNLCQKSLSFHVSNRVRSQ